MTITSKIENLFIVVFALTPRVSPRNEPHLTVGVEINKTFQIPCSVKTLQKITNVNGFHFRKFLRAFVCGMTRICGTDTCGVQYFNLEAAVRGNYSQVQKIYKLTKPLSFLLYIHIIIL